MVELNSVNLSLQLGIEPLLCAVLSPELLPILVFIVQNRVARLNYIHLQESTRSVFLSRDYLHLLGMVLQLSDHIIEHQLKRVQVTSHRELLFASVPTDQGVVFLQ